MQQVVSIPLARGGNRNMCIRTSGTLILLLLQTFFSVRGAWWVALSWCCRPRKFRTESSRIWTNGLVGKEQEDVHRRKACTEERRAPKSPGKVKGKLLCSTYSSNLGRVYVYMYVCMASRIRSQLLPASSCVRSRITIDSAVKEARRLANDTTCCLFCSLAVARSPP